MAARATALVPWLVVLACAGCWPSDDVPGGGPTTCQGGAPDGTCQELEDASNCPADCPPCTAIRVVYSDGPIKNPQAALGTGDGAAAELAGGALLVLEIGREVVNRAGTDLSLVGRVTSGSSASINVYNCAEGAASGQPLLVRAGNSAGAGSQALLGYWSQQYTGAGAANNTAQEARFDLACSETGALPNAKYVQIEAAAGATARLDAITATSCIK